MADTTRRDDNIDFYGTCTFKGPVVNAPSSGDASLTLGDGTGEPTLTLDKLGTDTAPIVWKSAGVKRASAVLDASENLVITTFAADGTTEEGKITIATATGVVTSAKGVTVADGTVTIAETGAPALVLSGAPEASATSALFRLGTAIASGSASGTFIGINAANGYAGNLVDWQVNGSSVFKVTAAGALTFGSVNLGSTAAAARSALNANILASTHYYSDIRGATAMSRQWAFGAAGFLQEVTVVLDAAIDANGSLTVTIDGNAVTFSSTTLTAAASGEGTVFRFTPTGGNTLLATSRIKIAIGGSNTNNVGAAIMCKITY